MHAAFPAQEKRKGDRLIIPVALVLLRRGLHVILALPSALVHRSPLHFRRGLHRLRLASRRRRAELRLLRLLLLDIVERHADDRLLNLRALLRALLPGLLSLALLVLPAPVLRPRQLHRLDALAVKADHLVVE